MKKHKYLLIAALLVFLVVNLSFVLVSQETKSEKEVDKSVVDGVTDNKYLQIFDKIILKQSVKDKFSLTQDNLKTSSEKTSKTSSEKSSKTSTKKTASFTGVSFVNTKEKQAVEKKPENIQSPVQENTRTVTGDNGFEMKIDYNKKTFMVDNKEYDIIIDGDQNIQLKNPASVEWEQLSYDRFDVFIEENYYAANTQALNELFNLFEPRYEYLEELTGWSSEKFYGKKLEIYVESTAYCHYGYAIPGESHNYLYYNLSDQEACAYPYYEQGEPYFNNQGELGDYWMTFGRLIHETLHPINPFPIFDRSWLTEGFSTYNQYNILVNFNDINQETADYYIYQENTAYNWQGYVNNDYHDTSPNNREIQDSLGYEISAWMFSMLRDDYNLNWSEFYSIVNNNLETLDKSYELATKNWSETKDYVDTTAIDFFGRSLDMDFDEIQAVFRYDGPDGPGWGVRHWESLDWYAELTPTLQLSSEKPNIGDEITITSTIYNNGDTNASNVSVKFYLESQCDKATGAGAIYEQIIDIEANSSMNLETDFIMPEGNYIVKVYVDKEKIKVESDETNNIASKTISAYEPIVCEYKKINGKWIKVCEPAEAMVC